MKEILSVGFPAIIMQAVGSFLTYGVNVIFGTLSASAVTAYGVYYKIQQFAFFAAFGMNNAMIPVIAFNYGSGDRERVRAGIRWGMITPWSSWGCAWWCWRCSPARLWASSP